GAATNMPVDAAAVPSPRMKLRLAVETILPSATMTTGKEHAPVPIPTMTPEAMKTVGSITAPRSFILGLGTAAASTGMFVAAPASSALIDAFGWQSSILVIAASFLLILPVLIFIARVSTATAKASEGGSIGFAIRTACSDRSFVLLFFGFFVCGFHVAFIQTHLPAFIQDKGLAASVGSWSLALIGLFNIAGSFASGWAGQRLSKRKSLAFLYTARAVVISVFIVTPLTPISVYVFSAIMGLLWLSTIPLTTGLIAQTQGLRFLSTLAGLIFLGHQTGSFLGAWLGGLIYDLYQDYTPMWWAAVIFGLMSTLLHLPIREGPGKLARAEAA
ncbi:MAG: MFS transporter, partial [Pseudomonadota bacterium]